MYKDEKDFFDEEWEKKQSQQQNNSRTDDSFYGNNDNTFSNWQSAGSSQPDHGSGTTKSKKAITITIVAVALVLVFVLGFVCALFFNNSGSQNNMLNDVLTMIRNQYYQDLTDEQWEQLLANGGTGLLQSLDQYSRLLTPQQAYDLVYGSSNDSGVDTSNTPTFGISMNLLGGIGLQVVSVTADSSAYGVLKSGDIILGLINPVTQEGTPVKDKDGQDVTQYFFTDSSLEDVNYIIAQTYTATFRILRNGETQDIELTRSIIGAGVDYKNMSFVRYYVKALNGNQYYNISMPQNFSNNTYTLHGLDKLEDGIGYIQLLEFSDLYNDQDQLVTGAAKEVKEVLTLFKSLGVKNVVLDLKGNPGGYVNLAADIIGMMATSDNLTQQQITDNNIVQNNKILATYLLGKNDKVVQTNYVTSTYNDYFDNDGNVHIVVWTDSNSASASELVTGALIDYGTAIQMGTTTYGKGIAQSIMALPYTGTIVNNQGDQQQFNWYVYMTIARFYSPLGNNIHGVGYTPQDQYNGLTEYSQLVETVNNYWN